MTILPRLDIHRERTRDKALNAYVQLLTKMSLIISNNLE